MEKGYWIVIIFTGILFFIAIKLQNWARNSGNQQNTKRTDEKRWNVKTQKEPKVLSADKAEKLLGKAEETGDRGLLFRIWRETDDEIIRLRPIRFRVYEDLIQSEEQVRFGGTEWIVLDRVDDRQLLLRKYALEGFRFGDGKNKQIHYEGEGYYYTFNCTWEMSLIRYYLNSEMFAEFSEEEQSRIIRVNADPVFVLSVEEYMKYSKTGIALRAAFTEKGICVTTWSRDQAGEEIHHGEWKPCFTTFKPLKDLEKIPSAGTVSYLSDLGREEFDRTFCIRPALWVKMQETNRRNTSENQAADAE